VSNGARFNFASNHPLNVTHQRQDAFAQADVLLALDVFDLSATLGVGIGSQRTSGSLRPETKIIHISVWDLLQHSWSTDFGRLHPVDLPITADSSVAIPQLIDECRHLLEKDSGAARRLEQRRKAAVDWHNDGEDKSEAASKRVWNNRPISQARLQAETWESIKDIPWSLVWGAAGSSWLVTEPEQIAGSGRGAGLGQSTGAAVGSALAHKGDGRLCVAIIGDGDFLYAPSALWTAANQSVPLLTIVNNNRSYGNDEGHQEHMARTRNRPIENKGVGIFIEEPKANFAALAGSLGVEGFGPVEDPEALRGVLDRAVSIVTREQRPVLVEVLTQRRT
jgi:thiamine pyrophosphate-dependent acetolactate synthase large subunit-like protein